MINASLRIVYMCCLPNTHMQDTFYATITRLAGCQLYRCVIATLGQVYIVDTCMYICHDVLYYKHVTLTNCYFLTSLLTFLLTYLGAFPLRTLILSIVCIHCFLFVNTFIRLIHVSLYFITFVSRQKQ